MATGVPPWKDSGLSNPVALYNYVKRQTSPPALNLSTSDDLESIAALKTLVAKCFRHDPDQRPTAQDLLKDPFLHVTHCFSDDDISILGRGLFSPSSTGSWDDIKTPHKADVAPARYNRHRRRSSIGSPARPFASPPLPKRHSPHVDTKDWPLWARASKNSVSVAPFDTTGDSLQYSNTSNFQGDAFIVQPKSPALEGLRFLSKS